ncbi:MAG: adenylosuccinate lyase family protein [Actinomycetia bacterium]|nr:adenylosuccinate lyase family protein [Actinomycetes bacterium]
MTIYLGDSTVYGHLWASDEGRDLLGEEARFASWLEILACLAEAQAQVGLVPQPAARTIRKHLDGMELDLDRVGEGTRATGHSTLGLIRYLREELPSEVREWVYYGATVQDVSDTWSALVMKGVGDLLERDLARLERAARAHAAEHRTTPMLGRTHAQPGIPISFGFKAAVWADEFARHRQRLREGRRRWEVVQLGGALGTMEFWGQEAGPLLEAFAARLDLGVPTISWITSRDRPAEFVLLLAMAVTTIAKIGNEIMELQRLELGEVREPFIPGTVGSITMPQKRNPEFSEHLDTLARLVRAQAAVMTEAMIQLHERDGRSWKAEWIALPQACTMTLAATRFAVVLLEGLVVDRERMMENIEARQGFVFGEPVMRALADRIGKHTAHDVVYEASMKGVESKVGFVEALLADRRVTAHLDREGIEGLFDLDRVLGAAPDFVDRVLGESA